MKTSKILISTLAAAAAMTVSASAAFVWKGGENITSELWATESSWDLTEGTTWKNTGTGPQTPDSESWAPIVVSGAKGEIGYLEGWELNLTLTNSELTVGGLKKFQGGCSVSIDADSTLTINNFGYTTGNDGGETAVTNYGTFNLQLAKDQGGDGFVMDLGSTGVFNVSGAHTAKIKSLSGSGTLKVAEGARILLTTATAGVSLKAAGAGTLGVALTTAWTNTISVSASDGESFTGTTYVTSGNFTINNSSFGETLQLADGANFQLSGGSTVSFDKALVLDGTTQVHQNSNATLTFTEDASVTGTGTYERRGGGTLTFDCDVSLGGFKCETGGTTTIFKGDTTLGTLTQSAGTINISGSTTINSTLTLSGGTFEVLGGGTLTIAGHDALSYSSGELDPNGKIVLRGSEGNVAKLVIADTSSMTLSKEIQLNGHSEISNAEGSTFNTYGGKITATGTDNVISSTIQLRRAFTVDVTNAADELTISGVLSVHSDGESGLTKTGAGTLTLSGMNTFASGVTVSAGTVVAENASALGTGSVTLSGGQLSIADGVTLNQTAITIALGSAYESVAAIIGEGALSADTQFTLTKADEAALALVTETATYTIFENASLAGTFTKDSFTLGGDGWDGWEISSYDTNSGVLTLTFTAIPEPSAFGLLAGVGALALVAARRRRSRK